MQDTFSAFWEVLDSYLDGDVVVVPYVPPHEMASCKDKMQVIGHVLEHGWRLCKVIPTRLCEASFIIIIHWADQVPEATLERS